MIKTFGDQENRANSYGIKGTSVLLICTYAPPPTPNPGRGSILILGMRLN